MKNLKIIHYLLTGVSAITVFLTDYFTKRWAVGDSFEAYEIVKGYAYFVDYQKNDGIAFGIDIPLWTQLVATAVILYFIWELADKHLFSADKPRVFMADMFGMVLGGAMGNLLDRVTNGYVVDFIVMRPFPVFNIADIGITVGLVLLFATILMDQRQSKI